MNEPDVDAELFRSLEQSLHRQEVRRSREAVMALLADDFTEFGKSGRVYDKAIVVDALAAETLLESAPLPEMHDVVVRALAGDVVLVTYRSVRTAQPDVLRSSIWRRVDGNWQMAFHQGTIAAADET